MRVVCTFAAYYAASICLTGGKLIIAAAAIMALGLIISMTLAHYIGGFFRTVEREARAEAERREREDAALAAGEEHRQEK